MTTSKGSTGMWERAMKKDVDVDWHFKKKDFWSVQYSSRFEHDETIKDRGHNEVAENQCFDWCDGLLYDPDKR